MPSLISTDIANSTWLLHSMLLVMAVYVRFSRIWSIRNLDLALILAVVLSAVMCPKVPTENLSRDVQQDLSENLSENLSDDRQEGLPGDIQQGLSEDLPEDRQGGLPKDLEQDQYSPVWQLLLFVFSSLLVVRLLFDGVFKRRPRLDQNLNVHGLTFLCIPAFAILMTQVFIKPVPFSIGTTIRNGEKLLNEVMPGSVPPSDALMEPDADNSRVAIVASQNDDQGSASPVVNPPPAPTEMLMAAGARQITESVAVDQASEDVQDITARILTVAAHSAVLAGLLFIGISQFGSGGLGVAMMCLYLLLPVTAYQVHQLNHVLPAAFLTWAVASHRKPIIAGILLGLACGTIFLTAILLPMWLMSYDRKGAVRFGSAVAVVGVILLTALWLASPNRESLAGQLWQSTNWSIYRLFSDEVAAPESTLRNSFRIPLAAMFLVTLLTVTFLPRQRNLESLIANSAAMVVAAQLWYPQRVGVYVLSYLPLFLLVMFRPAIDKRARFEPIGPEAARGRDVVEGTGLGRSGAAGSRVTLYR